MKAIDTDKFLDDQLAEQERDYDAEEAARQRRDDERADRYCDDLPDERIRR